MVPCARKLVKDTGHAPDDPGRLPAGAELHQSGELLAPSAVAHRHLVGGLLPAHRPRAGAGQVSSRLLRRPAVDAGHVRPRPRARRPARHPLREARRRHRAHRHGHGDRAARPRRDLFDQLLRAVPCGAAVRHARPDDRGRAAWNVVTSLNDGEAQNMGRDEVDRPRSALRPRRRVHGGRARPLGRLGGRRHRPGQGERPVRAPRQGPSPRPSRAILLARAGRSRCRARRRATRSSSRPARAAAASASARNGAR